MRFLVDMFGYVKDKNSESCICFFITLNISLCHCRLENMIQGGIRGAPAVEDPILRAAAVDGVPAVVVAAAEAGARAEVQRLNLRVEAGACKIYIEISSLSLPL